MSEPPGPPWGSLGGERPWRSTSSLHCNSQKSFPGGEGDPSNGVEMRRKIDFRARPSPPAEGDLVAAARAGDRDAFDSLARRHAARIVATARRILRSAADAEEAAADALLKAYRALGTLRPGTAFGAWLHRIACRAALDRLRARNAKARRHAPLAHDPDDARPLARTPVDRLAEAERIAAVRRAVNRLPPAQRNVVVLHAWEGLRYDAVAKILGCSYDAVRVNMAHARAALRGLLRLDDQGGAR